MASGEKSAAHLHIIQCIFQDSTFNLLFTFSKTCFPKTYSLESNTFCKFDSYDFSEFSGKKLKSLENALHWHYIDGNQILKNVQGNE